MNGHEPANTALAIVGVGSVFIIMLWSLTFHLHKGVYSRLGLKLSSFPRLLVIAHLAGIVGILLIASFVIASFVGIIALLYGFDTLVQLWVSSDKLRLVIGTIVAYLMVSWGAGMLFVEREAKRRANQ